LNTTSVITRGDFFENSPESENNRSFVNCFFVATMSSAGLLDRLELIINSRNANISPLIRSISQRYVPSAKKAIGGIFLDKERVTGIEGGCKALFVESFDPDAEMYYGGMVMQYALQPYVGALYAVTGTEFQFFKKSSAANALYYL
jgi:hypothetical protein